MNNQEIIKKALEVKEIDHVKLAEIAGFNSEEIEFVKLFWDPAFNNSWIYVTKQMVVEWLGYKENKATMGDFKKNLIKNYEENEDYKEVDKNDEIVKKFRLENFLTEKIANGTKFYLITGECLKGLLMSSNTMRGKLIKKIYIKTEKLVFIMLEVINKQTIMFQEQKLLIKEEEHQKQLAIEKTKSITLATKIQNDKIYKIEGWIYLATSKQYAQNNHFRLGQTVDLTKRMSGYKPGRTAADELYYVFVYKSETIEFLERIIRSFLKPYRDDVNIDMYTMHWNSLKTLVETICENYHNIMIPAANKLIVDNILSEEAPISPEKIDIKAIMQTNEEIALANGRSTRPQYYEQILESYKDYDIKIHTPKESIFTVYDQIDFSCPHSRRQVQTRTLLNGIGCKDCVKDKIIKDKHNELYSEQTDSFDEIEDQIIGLMDEESEEFLALGKMDKNRKLRQNELVKKLAAENIKLTSLYKNFDSKISIYCSFKHKTTTSWNALSKLKSEYCRTCRTLSRETQKIAIKSQATDQELIEAADAIGWKHIKKTGKKGIIEWECPNNHVVSKVFRELKRGYCAECTD